MTEQPDMRVRLCGVELKNPVIAASGTFGFGREFEPYMDVGRLGGIAGKGLTLQPRVGNAAPRVAETPSGMLNSVGLQNPGIEYFLKYELKKLTSRGCAVIANIAGNTTDEYCQMARRLADSAVDIVELNISCPNVSQGGVAFGAYPDDIAAIVSAVRPHCRQPLMVKLSPNTADIARNARAAQDAGADALSLINTLTGMAIHARSRRPVLANVTGGLSGPAIKPVALRMVYQAAQAVSIPVVGMGGIMTGEDAAEFMIAGATAVMVGTASLVSPTACIQVIEQLQAFLAANQIQAAAQLTGSLRA